ncbi:MAG: glycine cleavage T C-terminal barrel domain-containing protein, partial [Pseudomonadota bacterium]
GYAHRVGKSMAMGYVATPFATPGSELQVEILGELYAAHVQGTAVYDANGANMRA